MAIDPLAPPLLTADLSGIGGRIKVQPEDFEVEEIPAYEPAGNGDHLYLWLEKRNIGPEFFTRTIAQKLGVPLLGQIPLEIPVRESGDEGRPIALEDAAKSTASRAFAEVARQVAALVGQTA